MLLSLFCRYPFSIDETWELWKQLMEDYRTFTSWLTAMETEVRENTSDQPAAMLSREDVTRLEV